MATATVALATVATVTKVATANTMVARQSGPGTMGAHTALALVTVLTLSLAPLVTAAPRDLDYPSRGHHYVDRRSAEGRQYYLQSCMVSCAGSPGAAA